MLIATYESIEELRSRLLITEQSYLRRHGWEATCNVPGSYWLWRRDFTAEDEVIHERWKDVGPGPMGWPSEPKPMGFITAQHNLAVTMTRAMLDEDEEINEG